MVSNDDEQGGAPPAGREPLTPEGADLRAFAFMPLDVRRLLTSDTWVLGSAQEKVAALHLWLESWHQVPAASLPDDERMLAHLSGSGSNWRKVRTHAMRGWVKCRDGRLYHPVVAEKALEALERKQIQRTRGKAGAAKRWGSEQPAHASAIAQAVPEASTDDSASIANGSPSSNRQAMLADSKGQGQGERYSVPDGTGTAGAAPPDLPPLESKADLLDIPLGLLKPPGGDWGVPLFRQGLNWLAATVGKAPAKLRPQLGRWRKMAGDDDQRLFGLLVQAQRDRVADPLAWIEAALQDRPADGAPEVDHERIKRLAGVYVPDDDAVKRYAGLADDIDHERVKRLAGVAEAPEAMGD